MHSKGQCPLPLCVTGLEITDEDNTSTVWDDPFDTDREAPGKVLEVIERDGIRSFMEGDAEEVHEPSHDWGQPGDPVEGIPGSHFLSSAYESSL